MTSGGKDGASGGRLDWVPLAGVVVVGLIIAVINATSGIMEAQARGEVNDPRGPWVFELSSVIIVVALTPLIGWMVRRVPPPMSPKPGPIAVFAGAHLAAGVVFSLAHILGMVLLRKAAYAAVGQTYIFADMGGGLGLPIIYEGRKDILTYAVIAGLTWAWGWLVPRAFAKPESAPVTGDNRIEIRDGARVMLVEPGEITSLEAAGNYVEIHVGGRTHLARATLSAFEAKLAGRGFVRIHRSRLVNRARVKAFRPTASGDLEIDLDDGRTIAGSRRFRSAMETA